jgi:hypothetical protein
MNAKELQEIKEMAMNYGDPIRGKLLACVVHIECLNIEKEALV